MEGIPGFRVNPIPFPAAYISAGATPMQEIPEGATPMEGIPGFRVNPIPLPAAYIPAGASG